MSYDTPNATVRREQSFLSVAGNGAVSARMRNYQKSKLVAAHWEAVTAGTSAGHTLIVKKGTTAIGTATLGTTAAGGTGVLDCGDAEITAGQLVSCTNGTDATGVALVTYEYEVYHDAVPST